MIDFTKVKEISLENEKWKQIPKYPNYLVSNMGRVYSGYANKIDNGTKNKKGYRIIELHENKQKQKYKFSHLVAMAFCKNYADGKHVHHVNRKRDDDRAVNLFPCTPSEHRAIHAIYTLLANNIDVLAELIQPIICCNVDLFFNDTKGGDAA